MIEAQPLSMGEHTPTAGEVGAARLLHRKRIDASPWRKLDFMSEDAQAYRTSCAIVADRSDDLERLLESQFRIEAGNAAPDTPVRKLIRERLLGTATAGSVEIWARPLRFYPYRELVEFRLRMKPEKTFALRFVCVERAHWSDAPVIAIPLTGNSPPIHEINAFMLRDTANPQFLDVAATDGTVEDYLKFFCAHVGSEDGYFQIVEGPEDFLPQSAGASPEGDAIYGGSGEALFRWLNDEDADGPDGAGKATPHISLETLLPMVIPIARVAAAESDRDRGGAHFATALIYADVFFNAIFRVNRNGTIDMVNDFAKFDNRPLPLTALRDLRHPQEILGSVKSGG